MMNEARGFIIAIYGAGVNLKRFHDTWGGDDDDADDDVVSDDSDAVQWWI